MVTDNIENVNVQDIPEAPAKPLLDTSHVATGEAIHYTPSYVIESPEQDDIDDREAALEVMLKEANTSSSFEEKFNVLKMQVPHLRDCIMPYDKSEGVYTERVQTVTRVVL
jgi:hypothetical protein